MFVKFKAIVKGIAGWAIRFGASIIRFIGVKTFQLLVWGIKALPRLIGAMWKGLAWLLKAFFPGFGHIIVAIVNGIGRLIGRIPLAWGVARAFLKTMADDILLRLMLFRDWAAKAFPRLTRFITTWFATFLARFQTIKAWLIKTAQEAPGKISKYIGKIIL
mgnify:CR=1 FL=1